jgi:hypothetical protein
LFSMFSMMGTRFFETVVVDFSANSRISESASICIANLTSLLSKSVLDIVDMLNYQRKANNKVQLMWQSFNYYINILKEHDSELDLHVEPMLQLSV